MIEEEPRPAVAASDQVADWWARIRAGRAAEGPVRTLVWILLAALLVAGPVAFSLARTTDYVAAVQLDRKTVQPLSLPFGTQYFRQGLNDRSLRERMSADHEAGFGEYRRAAFVARGSGLVIALRSSSPERAEELANGVAREIIASNRRYVAFRWRQRLRAITIALRSDRWGPRIRRRLVREQLALRGLGPAPPGQLSVGVPAARPPLRGTADKVANALPGPMPLRASPFWAGAAGLLTAAALWVLAFVLAPPPGYVAPLRGPRERARRPRLRDRLPAGPAPGAVSGEPEPLGLPWWGRSLWIAALAAMPIVALLLIATYGKNLPFYDEWTNVLLFAAHDAGTLDFGDFWQQSNEHRPVIPKAADFVTALLTGWDLRVEMYRNFVVAVATFALILLLLRRTLDRFGFVAVSVVASVVFFSPVQWENWLWGWQLEWFLSNLGVVVAVWALCFTIDRSPRRGLALAMAGAVVATFSLGSGLLMWVVGLVLLLLRRRPWRLWAAASVLVYGVYFSGWENTNVAGSKSLFLERPLAFADFVTLYFGRAFAISDGTGNLVGGVVIVTFLAAVAYVVAHRRDTRLRDRAAPWVGIGLYALAAGLLTGVSRVLQTAAASRYSTIAGLLAIAMLALVTVILREERVAARPIAPRVRRRLGVALAAVVVLAAVVNARHGVDQAKSYGAKIDRLTACAHAVTVTTSAPPCLKELSPYAETPSWITYLRRKGWGGF